MPDKKMKSSDSSSQQQQSNKGKKPAAVMKPAAHDHREGTSCKLSTLTGLQLPEHSSRSVNASRQRRTDPCVSQISRIRLKEMEEVFRYFDADGDGKISNAEMRSFFESMGEHDICMRLLMAKEKQEDDDQSVKVMEMGLEEFVKMMDQEDSREEDLRNAFEMFQMEKGSGCITAKGLQRFLRRIQLGEKTTTRDCEAMIRFFDLNGDGVLDFHEFTTMMNQYS